MSEFKLVKAFGLEVFRRTYGTDSENVFMVKAEDLEALLETLKQQSEQNKQLFFDADSDRTILKLERDEAFELLRDWLSASTDKGQQAEMLFLKLDILITKTMQMLAYMTESKK